MFTSEKKTVLYIVILAAAIRVYIAVATPVIGTDSYNFTVSAKLFSEGNYLEAIKEPIHPLYPILMSIGSVVTGEYETSGKAVSLVFGVLTVVVFYFLARHLFGHKAACFSSLFLAINPSHVRLSASVLSDATYIFFFIFTIWVIIKTHKEVASFIYYPVIGLLIFFAFITRAEGISLLAVAMPWLFFLNWKVKRYSLTKNAFLLFLVFIIFISTAAGYLLFVGKEDSASTTMARGFAKGRIFTQQLAASYFFGTSKAKVPSISDPGVKARTVVKGRLPTYVRLAQWKENGQYHRIAFYVINECIKECYYPSIIFIFLGVFRLFPQTTGAPNAPPGSLRNTGTSTQGYASGVLAYVWGSLRLRKAASDLLAEYFLLALLTFYFLVFFKFAFSTYYFSGRYAMPLVVVSLMWSGVGLVVASEYLALKIPRLRNHHVTPQTVLVVTLALVFVITLPKSLKIRRQKGAMQKEAGLWIKENFPEIKNPAILGNQVVAFYADGKHREILKETPYGYLLRLTARLSPGERKMDFLAFYKEDFWNSNNETFEAIEKDQAFVFLKEWVDHDGAKERHLRVYRVNSRWFAEVYLSIGMTSFEGGFYKLASIWLERALRFTPEDFAANNRSPEFLVIRDDLRNTISSALLLLKAENLPKKPIKTNGSFLEYHAVSSYYMGCAYIGQGLYNQAMTYLEEAIRIAPDYAEAHAALGLVYKHTDKYNEAITHLKDAIGFKPDYAEAHYALGVIYQINGKYDLAAKHAERALQIKPDYKEPRTLQEELHQLAKKSATPQQD